MINNLLGWACEGVLWIIVAIVAAASFALATSPITMIVLVSCSILPWWWILISIPACFAGITACFAFVFLWSLRNWSLF